MEFTSYPPSRLFYGGAEKKDGRTIDNNDYMIKIANEIPDENRNALNSSHSNSPISEHIACGIIKTTGLPVQDTILGTHEGNVAVACKDFTSQRNRLVEFAFLENQVIHSSSRGRTPILCNLEKTFESSIFEGIREAAIERYWDTFFYDALLGNFDRHSGNWGYLQDYETKELLLAPIYDCGSSLYPGMGDHILYKTLYDKEAIQERIDVFPKAALIINEKDGKVGYKEMFTKIQHPECMKALYRNIEKLDFNKINQVIEGTPLISDIRKEFYKVMIKERYSQILLEPYLEHSKSKDFSLCTTPVAKRFANAIEEANKTKKENCKDFGEVNKTNLKEEITTEQ